jgi:RimJ/RimL family protein N-acetyltransferase
MGIDGYPQQVTLHDGTRITLSLLESTDGPCVTAFYRGLPEEERMVLKDDVMTDGWAERFLANVARKEVVSVLAKKGRIVVGEASLYRTLHGWTRHVGEVRVAVDKSERRKGLATELAAALVKTATDLGIEKIIVQVVENQLGARRIFEKLGFRKDAILPHHVMDLSGQKRDLIVLANDVSQIWAAMEAMIQDFSPLMGD